MERVPLKIWGRVRPPSASSAASGFVFGKTVFHMFVGCKGVPVGACDPWYRDDIQAVLAEGDLDDAIDVAFRRNLILEDGADKLYDAQAVGHLAWKRALLVLRLELRVSKHLRRLAADWFRCVRLLRTIAPCWEHNVERSDIWKPVAPSSQLSLSFNDWMPLQAVACFSFQGLGLSSRCCRRVREVATSGDHGNECVFRFVLLLCHIEGRQGSRRDCLE